MSEQPKCGLCGEPMPPGEEMFQYHGYSGPCPKLPLEAKKPLGMSEADEDLMLAENEALTSRIATLTAALQASTELLQQIDHESNRPMSIKQKAQIAANEALVGGK